MYMLPMARRLVQQIQKILRRRKMPNMLGPTLGKRDVLAEGPSRAEYDTRFLGLLDVLDECLRHGDILVNTHRHLLPRDVAREVSNTIQSWARKSMALRSLMSAAH